MKSRQHASVVPPRTLVLLLVLAVFSNRPGLRAQALDAGPQAENPQSGENHRKAAEWFFQQRAYPGNSIPKFYRFEALEYMRGKMGYRWERTPFRKELTTGSWVEIGPNNVGGRILAIAIHPTDDNIVYAGAADGGVFKTTDAGKTWVALNDMLPSLAVASLVLDPKNPDIVYAGTGEGTFNSDAAVGKGVMKSIDGGATWTFSSAFASYVNRLAIHPTQTNTLYAATRTGVFKTTDANKTWTAVLSGHNCIDVSLDPQNPNVVLTSVWDRASAQTENGIWRTADGGSTWTRVSSGLPEGRLIGHVSLARSLSNSQIVYAGVAQFSFSLPALGIFKTTDGGVTWSQLPDTPSYCGTQCWYDNELAVHPTNSDILFAAGLNLWKSTDGGATWARSDVGVHVDHHALAFSKADPNIVYSGNDGGMYRSADGGTTWTALNYGLGATQFYALAISATDPTITYGGTQDNGTQKGSGAAGFQLVLGGDGMVPIVDYTDANFVYAETQNGGLSRSTNGGISFVTARSGITSSDRFNWVTPWVIDPVDPQLLYAGSHRLYKSTNRAVSWTLLSNDLTKGTGMLSTIVVAPSDPNTIYTGSSDGLVSVATDGGASTSSFKTITSGLPNRYVTRLRVHPTDAKTVYATFSGFNSSGTTPGHVFKTTSRGESWVDISSNLPDLPVQVIVIDPKTPSTLYIGTDLGCFRSVNDGQSWDPFNEGLPNVVVDDMALFGNTNLLRVATHGRGIWQYVTSGRTPASIKPIVGNKQKALAGADLAFPVRVAVLDADGVPVPDTSVTFEIVSSGAGGTFADGTVKAVATTDAFGVANLPRLMLNSTTGALNIEVSAGGAPSASLNIETTSTAPQLTNINPNAALAGQVITGGQNLLLSGSGFSSPFFVYYTQNGTWYATTSNTFLNSSTQIYATIPSGLVLGKASVVVSRGGEFSQPVAIDITNVSTPPAILGILPATPSPGQQFSATLTGQIPFTERFTFTQGGTSVSGTNDTSLPGSAVFTVPSFPFKPGSAKIDIRNHNSPSASSFSYSIPDQPVAPVLLAPALRAPEQLLSLPATGYSAVPQYNVAIFAQGSNTVEVPGVAFSSNSLLVPVPGKFTTGSASVRVRSTFSNGTATSTSLSFTIGPPATISTPTISPLSIAPGGRATVTSLTTGAFNTISSRNRITVSAGGHDYNTTASTVSVLGTTITFTVPKDVLDGSATLQIISDFGDQSVTRVQNASLNIIGVRQLTTLSGDMQTTDAGKSFSTPLSLKVTEKDGSPVANASVTFSAPATVPSGFFEIGGSRNATVITGTDGVATAPVFKARNNGGVYLVKASLSGHPSEAFFTLRNRNLADQRDLSLAANGAQISETAGAEVSTGTGYVTVSATGGQLAGASIFSLRYADGNLITEAAVPDSVSSTSSLLFIDARSGVQTGVALVNTNDVSATVTLRLRDAAGILVGNAATIQLKPREQTARFFSEFFSNLSSSFVGTVSIDSTASVAAVSLRAVTNSRKETIYSALPVALTTTAPEIAGEISFPHLAIGGGYRTSIILLNPTGKTITGKLSFFDNKGTALSLDSTGNDVNYSIPPNSHYLLEATGSNSATVTTGYALARADAGNATPTGTLLFSGFTGDTLVAEAAVPGSKPLTHALLYVDTQSTVLRDSTETRSTGLAIANRANSAAKIRLILRDLKGNVLGIPRTIDLPAGQQTARFIDEEQLLGPRAQNLRGSLEVTSDTPIDILTLRGTMNRRDEFLFTTLPVADYAATAQSALLCAHLADGGGYATQTVLLDPSATSGTATVRYLGKTGAAVQTDLR